MNKRFEWIDNLRGMAIVSMILYHTAWDLVYLYGVNWKWYHSDAAFLWQQSICWTFIFLSGFCWSFHRRPLKQGVVISIAGVLVSIVTCFFDAGSRILFGVITLLGAVTFLMIPLEKVLKKIKPIKGLWMMFLLFAVTYSVNEGSIGFFGWKIYALPTIIYDGFFRHFWDLRKMNFIRLITFRFFHGAFYFLQDITDSSYGKSEVALGFWD